MNISKDNIKMYYTSLNKVTGAYLNKENSF